MAEEKSISGRWAARKQAVLQEQQVQEEQLAQELEIAREEALPEKTEAEILEELDLPNPDELGAGDDFTGFMKASVPAAIRNRALRNLWRSNSTLANLDGLLDYGEDFTGNGKAGEVIKTAYQVGKGFAQKLKEVVGEDLDEELDDDVQSDSEISGENLEELPEKKIVSTRPPGTKPDLTPITAPQVEVSVSAPEEIAPKKRMVFRYEE